MPPDCVIRGLARENAVSIDGWAYVLLGELSEGDYETQQHTGPGPCVAEKTDKCGQGGSRGRKVRSGSERQNKHQSRRVQFIMKAGPLCD